MSQAALYRLLLSLFGRKKSLLIADRQVHLYEGKKSAPGDMPRALFLYASTIFCIQSPQRMLTFFVARTLWPQQGQMSLRLLLGRFSPGALTVLLELAAPVNPECGKAGKEVRAILISDQPFEIAYSIKLSPGVVFQPY